MGQANSANGTSSDGREGNPAMTTSNEPRYVRPGRSTNVFNEAVADFIARVEAGRWPARDPRSMRT